MRLAMMSARLRSRSTNPIRCRQSVEPVGKSTRRKLQCLPLETNKWNNARYLDIGRRFHVYGHAFQRMQWCAHRRGACMRDNGAAFRIGGYRKTVAINVYGERIAARADRLARPSATNRKLPVRSRFPGVREAPADAPHTRRSTSRSRFNREQDRQGSLRQVKMRRTAPASNSSSGMARVICHDCDESVAGAQAWISAKRFVYESIRVGLDSILQPACETSIVSPGSMTGRNSMTAVPGFRKKLRRGQNIPVFSATGTTRAPSVE